MSRKRVVLFFNKLKVMLVLLFEKAGVFRPTFPNFSLTDIFMPGILPVFRSFLSGDMGF